MKRLMLFPLLAAATLLDSCAAVIQPVSPAQVAAVESGVTIAETLALNYTRLPPCPAATKVCADPATKTKIKAYGQTARDAVKALQASSAAGAPAALAAAQAALTALQSVTPAPAI